MRKIALFAPLGAAVASFAATTGSNGEVTADIAGMQDLADKLTSASTDVSQIVGPAAILIPLAIGAIVIGRSVIKKFFKV